MKTFYEKLQDRWQQGKYVCIGLDIDEKRLPGSVAPGVDAIERIRQFLFIIISVTHQSASAYKLNSAHYERFGAQGVALLEEIIRHIHQEYPSIPVILDAKRGDIADTNIFYAQAAFDELNADVVTVHPYMGKQSLIPFLSRKDKGIIVMGANSAEGAEEFQDVLVGDAHEPLYKYVSRCVAQTWNYNKNCSVTAGANDPRKLGDIRSVVGEMPILLLGIGAQGGDLVECMKYGKASQSLGLIINSSRAILYASAGDDFERAAQQSASRLNRQITELYT